MIKRENRRSRRPAVREQRSQILIVCGGDATEQAYFRGLKKVRRNPAVKVMVDGKGVDAAIERASGRCPTVGTEHRHNPSTGVWALVEQVS